MVSVCSDSGSLWALKRKGTRIDTGPLRRSSGPVYFAGETALVFADYMVTIFGDVEIRFSIPLDSLEIKNIRCERGDPRRGSTVQ